MLLIRKFVQAFVLWYERSVTITVRDLVSTPDFRTRVLVGASGIDREVSWAHVCELPDPTEYLAHGATWRPLWRSESASRSPGRSPVPAEP